MQDQDKLEILLINIFGQENVKKNWDIAKDSADLYERRDIYTPRLDFAIGPFNITRSVEENLRQINENYRRHSIIKDLTRRCNMELDANFNKNPRCFIAIEIENRTSRKHRLGSMINAAALGKIAIMVGANNKVVKSFKRLLNYLFYLDYVKKTRWAPRNILLVEMEEFIDVLQHAASSQK